MMISRSTAGVVLAVGCLVAGALACSRRPPVGTVTVLMDPAPAAGFFSMPWPSDSRLRTDGSIDATGFPGRDLSPAAQVTITNGEKATHGFGTNSAVFFRTSAGIDPASLPTPDGSTGRRSPVMLLDLDHPGAPPAPLRTHVEPRATALRPADLLALLPYPGYPLQPRTRYAAVVLDGVRDTAGRRLAPAPLLRQLDGPAPAGTDPVRWPRLRDQRDEAIAALGRQTGWQPGELVAFTVFTTQDTTRDLRAVTAAGPAHAPPRLEITMPAPGTCDAGRPVTWTGGLDLPRWQQGTKPFLVDGGAIEIDGTGRAVAQGTEHMPVEVTVPCVPPPPSGWPILLYMDGTGANVNGRALADLGVGTPGIDTVVPYAIFSIPPVLSGDRRVDSPLGDLTFYNFVNPLAGRTNQVQQAADMVALAAVARGAVVNGGAIPLDRERVVVAGHSQGALTLPLTLAADPTIRAAFISSGGAGFYHAVAHRGDLQQPITTLLPVAPGELDTFHPLVHLLQTFAEIGDAANYASQVTQADVAVYGGLLDGCSPIEASVHLARALGVPVARPVTRQPLFGSTVLEPRVVDLPVSRNLGAGRTGVLVELDDGHFGAGSMPMLARSFLDSIAGGGPTRVEAGPQGGSGPPGRCLRADEPPRA